MDSADGLRPTSLTTGPSPAYLRSILLMLDFTITASGQTNRCPEKSGAAHGDLEEIRGEIEAVDLPDPQDRLSRAAFCDALNKAHDQLKDLGTIVDELMQPIAEVVGKATPNNKRFRSALSGRRCTAVRASAVTNSRRPRSSRLRRTATYRSPITDASTIGRVYAVINRAGIAYSRPRQPDSGIVGRRLSGVSAMPLPKQRTRTTNEARPPRHPHATAASA